MTFQILMVGFVALALGFLAGFIFFKFHGDMSLRAFQKSSLKEEERPGPELIPEMKSLPFSCRSWIVGDGLDAHQQEALTSPARISLVLAGAGAGKTKVLTKRIILLHRFLDVPLQKMMVLAFNESAAQEISKRVSDQLNIPMESLFKKNIRTIHSLAYEIYRSENVSGRIVSDEKEMRNTVKEILATERDGLGATHYVDEVVELFGDYPRAGVRQFERKKELKGKVIVCSDGTQVRSNVEKAIVEELNRRGVQYLYEPTVTWAERYFQPDFYLPEYDAYIEYWGMYNYEDPIIRDKYRRDLTKKKGAFKKFRFFLIDLFPASKAHPIDPVVFLGKRLDRMSPKKDGGNEGVKIRDLFHPMEDQVIELILGVGAILTSYGRKIQDIIPASDPFVQRILRFIAPFYDRLEDRLRAEGKTTFNLFLKGALTILQNNPALLAKYQEKFKFIFVDEVQDLMPLTRDFIRILVGPGQSLFAIGDDYQSIYSFAGSDPSLIVKFDSYFEGAHKIKLVHNYRCHPRIVDVSNVIIKNNKVQEFKESRGVYRAGQEGSDQAVVLLTGHESMSDMGPLVDAVFSVIPGGENLTVLSRYRESNPTRYCQMLWMGILKAFPTRWPVRPPSPAQHRL